MNIASIKLPIAVIGIIVAQAFGIIWYVATLDSTVSSLEEAVEEIRLNTAETSVAVIQNDIANIKINVEKLEQTANGKTFDDGALWKAIEVLTGEVERRDGEVRLGLEEVRQVLEGRASSSDTLQNVLDGKGAVWKKSDLKASIDALRKDIVTVGEDIEKNHPPKDKPKRQK
jgi:hypothetical protein